MVEIMMQGTQVVLLLLIAAVVVVVAAELIPIMDIHIVAVVAASVY
jgi:hypothetical protein